MVALQACYGVDSNLWAAWPITTHLQVQSPAGVWTNVGYFPGDLDVPTTSHTMIWDATAANWMIVSNIGGLGDARMPVGNWVYNTFWGFDERVNWIDAFRTESTFSNPSATLVYDNITATWKAVIWTDAARTLSTNPMPSGTLYWNGATWAAWTGTVAATQSGAWTVAATQSGAWSVGRTWTLAFATDFVDVSGSTVAATQSGAWAVSGVNAASLAYAEVLIAVANTAVQFGANVVAAGQAIMVRARSANAGNVFVGLAGVTTANAPEMEPGEVRLFYLTNTNILYVNGANVGDGIRFEVEV